MEEKPENQSMKSAVDDAQSESEQKQEPAPIKRSFTINQDSELKYETRSPEKKSGKTILLIIVLLVVFLVGGFFLNNKFHFLPGGSGSDQLAVATPSPTFSPTPTPAPALIKSDWSFEVLNGSGVTGEAKRVADEIKVAGYEVVKTGNADKSSYLQTEILVKEELLEKIDLVISDLKDIIKIASVAVELTEGTASARIIIGKDSI